VGARGHTREGSFTPAAAFARLLAHLRERVRTYSAARNLGYTFACAASFAGKALALAQGAPKALGPPRGPYREGRAAAPPRTLPRTVRSRADCRLS
jgi:hypothetical protein